LFNENPKFFMKIFDNRNMKTINQKILFIFSLSLLIQGCMPDSLTKFQKSTPKPQDKAADIVVVQDPKGVVIPSAQIDYPTYFYYKINGVQVTDWNAIVDNNYEAGGTTTPVPALDGTLLNNSMIISCDIKPTTGLPCISQLDLSCTPYLISSNSTGLPAGLYWNSADCSIYGKPTQIWSDITLPGYNGVGQNISYTAKLTFQNGKNYAPGIYTNPNGSKIVCNTRDCSIESQPLFIGAYKKPANLVYNQSDKLGVGVDGFTGGKGINEFTIEDNLLTTRTDNIISATNSIGSIQIIDKTLNVLYVNRAIPLTLNTSVSAFMVGMTVGNYDTIKLSVNANNPPDGTVGVGMNQLPTNCKVGDIISSGSYIGNVVGYSHSLQENTQMRVFRTISSGSVLSAGSTLTCKDAGTLAVLDSYVVADASLESPARGKVLSVETIKKIIHVTQSTDFPGDFLNRQSVTVQGFDTPSLIESIDKADGFREKESIDNDNQYYAKEAGVISTTNYYSVNKLLEALKNPIQPNVSGADQSLIKDNGVTFKISPALPLGLSFDTTSGYITGTFFDELPPTTFTITATNKLGSTNYKANISAVYPPKDLSYTTNQIIQISNAAITSGGVKIPNSVFYEGEEIFQPITPPATKSVHGIIKRKIGNDLLQIEVYNGTFQPGASIDSGRAFVAEKAFISATAQSYNYQVALYLDLLDDVIFPIGSYISSSGNALGRVVFKDVTRKVVYVQFLTADTSISPIPFKEGEGVSLGTSYNVASNLTKINTVETNVYRLKMTNVNLGIFTIGKDITTTPLYPDLTAKAGGYIYNVDISNQLLYVDNISKTPSMVDSNNIPTNYYPEFKISQIIDPAIPSYELNTVALERYNDSDPAKASISEVATENTFIIKRDEEIVLNPNLSQGSELNFTVVPTLPIGLVLDPAKGIISGKAQYLTTLKTYIITARNLMGSSSYKFNLEVRDYFKISEVGDSSSLVLHKVGDTQNTRGCQINGNDILHRDDREVDTLDIRCYLEGEEEDLHFNPLKFKAMLGSGVCEYIQYTPFLFQQFIPEKAYNYDSYYVGDCKPPAQNLTFSDDTVEAAKLTTDAPTPKCPAKYATDLHPEYPNCDESVTEVKQIMTKYDSDAKVCNVTGIKTEYLKCGGNINACLVGPGRDILHADIDKGYRSLITHTNSGADLTWIHSSPSDAGDVTNLRVANYTTRNSCSTSNDDLNNWIQYIATKTDKAKLIQIKAKPDPAAQNIFSDNVEGLGGNPFLNGQPAYIFNCLDAAYDVKARIRLYVRDWDRRFKITDHIDVDNPDALLSSNSITCADKKCKRATRTSTDSFGYSYNRYYTWDDNYMSVGNLYYNEPKYNSIYYNVLYDGNNSANNYSSCTSPTTPITMPGTGKEYAFPAEDI
jgi:hypothetical protein